MGWVHAVGEIENVELKIAGKAADPRRSFSGRFSVVQLNGPLRGPYGVTLARADTDRIELVGGLLLRARSIALDVMFHDGGEALTAPAPALPMPSGATPSWGAQASARAQSLAESDEDGAEEEEMPEPGDLVQHFAFGICEVLGAEGDRLTTRDLSRPGRVREIRTRHLRIEAPREHDGKRLFPLSKKE
jgi:hypothetical protein